MNTVSIVGTGYVGLVTGVCLSEFGMNVMCMDNDKDKIESLKLGEVPIYEPGLRLLMDKNIKAGRLNFSTNISDTIKFSSTIFIAVGTPPKEDGSADLHYVLDVVRSIAERMDEYKVIVIKSTVPLGTARKVKSVVESVLKERSANIEFDVVSNPEFLREGAAVRDFMHPDRVVVGYESEKAMKRIKQIYNVLYLNETPFIFTEFETAELIKYATNAFLATKVGFINEIAMLCDAAGSNVQDVAKAMGMDGRIGKYFLHAGPGYGGSCFPKDTRALVKTGKDYNVDMSIVRNVISANEKQKHYVFEKIKNKMINVEGKTFALLGLAFKPETDDVRESPAIKVALELLSEGATIRVFDPAAMENARKFAFADALICDKNNESKIVYCKDENDAVLDADAVVLFTEWNQFRQIDLPKLRRLMKGKNFFDMRNVYSRNDMEKYGFIYDGIGQ